MPRDEIYLEIGMDPAFARGTKRRRSTEVTGYVGVNRLMGEILDIANRLREGDSLSEDDVSVLLGMLEANHQLEDKYPGTFLLKHLRMLVNEDGEFDRKNWRRFERAIKGFAHPGTRRSTKWVPGSDDGFDRPEGIVFYDRCFCFTGKFEYGVRSRCERAVTKRWGRCTKSPTFDTDYLVVGSLGGAGAKLEKAHELKKRGSLIQIVGEPFWCSQVRAH